MAQYWEIDLYYTRENREPIVDAKKDREQGWEETVYHGRPVYKFTVETDSYESGASGTLALYYSEDHERMDRVISLRDPDLITYDARLKGEPEEPDEPEESDTADEDIDWDQSAS